jgi:MSHA biogenesis protein MshM
MGRDEIDYYIQHRLSVAGHRGTRVFTRPAMWLLKLRTKCVPRLVNIVAHKALLSAYGRGRNAVTFWDVNAAVNDTASLGNVESKFRFIFLLLMLFGSTSLLLIDKGYFR